MLASDIIAINNKSTVERIAVKYQIGVWQMRYFTTVIVVFIYLCLYTPPAAALEKFSDEQQAQQHCPKDTVVWLNLPTMIWHYKGQRWYGRTKQGAFVCEKEASAAGARATRNGE